jgi:peptide/nickel transport system permease protein
MEPSTPSTQEQQTSFQDAARLLGKKSLRHRSNKPLARVVEALVKNHLAQVGLAGILLVLAVTLLAPVIAPYDPVDTDYKNMLGAPDSQHWFGTDDLGRDVFSRVLWGGRESMRAGFLAVIIGLGGGVVLGILSGYIGGGLDDFIQRIVEILMAFPTILLLLSIIAAIGPNLTTVVIALGITSIPGYSRLFRGSVISAKNNEYVTAARLVGATDGRIMFSHILPNIIAPILVYGTLNLAGAIMMTAGLSYLGMGAQPPSPEWGAMLNYGRAYMRAAWWMSIFPGFAIFLTMVSINLFGDGIRDTLDPKTREA